MKKTAFLILLILIFQTLCLPVLATEVEEEIHFRTPTPRPILQVQSPKSGLTWEKGGKLTYEEKVEYYKTVNHKLYSQVNSDLMKEVITTFNGTFGE